MYRRKYKITLTIDAPISDKYGMDEDSIADLLKAYLKVHNPEIFEISKQPLEEIHEDWQDGPLNPEDDPEDITKFPNAVGYIVPDGKFYGGEDGYDPLMHVLYAKEVWEAYKDKISENTIRTYGHSSGGLDYDLERWGFDSSSDSSDIKYDDIPEGSELWWRKYTANGFRWVLIRITHKYGGILFFETVLEKKKISSFIETGANDFEWTNKNDPSRYSLPRHKFYPIEVIKPEWVDITDWNAPKQMIITNK